MGNLNNNQPLVSVIINCFNGEKYLRDALLSVLEQTYSNWEIIFWDNKSTDNSKKIFNEFNDERLKYFISDTHTYLYEARNKAITKSKGSIIAFLDTDDWWEKDKLEKQILLFKDAEVGLVYSNCYLKYQNSKRKEIAKKKVLKSGYITKELFESYDIGILTVLLRKEAYNSILGFGNQYKFSGDFDLFIRLSSKWKISCVQKPLAYYRIHNDNYTFVNNVNHEAEIEDLEKWLNDPKINSNKNLKPYLHHVNRRITFLRTIKYLNEGKMIKALKNIIFFPIGIKKVQLILHFILPKIILKRIKKFHPH